jgi:hypothetical protein
MMLKRFHAWWHAPLTSRDRRLGVVVGGIGGFWIGLLGRVVLGATPAGPGEVIAWVVVGTVSCAVAGYRFPKPVTIVLFPFVMSGFST